MLKVREILNKDFGRAFTRISEALHKYSPPFIEWVSSNEDLTLVHVVGGGEVPILNSLDNYIIFQHCYLTAFPDLINWQDYWYKSALTVAFRDLREYATKEFNFCHSPWGADEDKFKFTNSLKDVDVFVTGHIASTEHIDTLYKACQNSGKLMYHTGQNFRWSRTNYNFVDYMSDAAFVTLLNRTKYVSCMRTVEGFEMAGVEGLFCGAVPIVPDLPTYSWYNGFGIYVDMLGDVETQLTNILKHKPEELISVDFNKAREVFNWKNIVPNIFSSLEKLA